MEPHVLEACLEYTRSVFAPEDSILREIREEIRRRGWPEMAVSPEEGRVLQVLLRAVGAERVLEIGTYLGYSAVWIARALPAAGRLVTIEKDREYAERARAFIRRAGLEDKVEVRVGRAARILEGLEGATPFDAVFIDADKANYPRYLEWSLARVRRGGLILADNAFWEGKVADPQERDEDTLGIREYNRRAAEDPRVLTTILPVRDGLAVSVVTA